MSHRVTELHCIMPIANIPSVLEHGLLSHERVCRLPHTDVSMGDVQDRRDKVRVPGGLRLHQYANLYFDARNPMMSRRRNMVNSLCVLRYSVQVLQLDGAIITDQNAASRYVAFWPPSSINMLDFDLIFAEDWTHNDDQIAYWRHKSIKCAEVLVPNTINCDYLTDAYVVNEDAQNQLLSHNFGYQIEINPHIFFR